MNITDNKSLNILLVEDNPADVELTRNALAEAGVKHVLAVAEDGEEGLQYLERSGKFSNAVIPSLIILDINLPKLSGKEILKSVRMNDKLKNIPVIMLTSSQSKTDITESYRLEADYYMTKPIDADKFKQIIGGDSGDTEWSA